MPQLTMSAERHSGAMEFLLTNSSDFDAVNVRF